jgi:hypothetical protein
MHIAGKNLIFSSSSIEYAVKLTHDLCLYLAAMNALIIDGRVVPEGTGV